MLICLWVSSGSQKRKHYSDVIMSPIASQITYVSIVCPCNCLFMCRSKKASKLRLTGVLIRGIHRWPLVSLTKGQQCGKCFLLMTSSCKIVTDVKYFVMGFRLHGLTMYFHILQVVLYKIPIYTHQKKFSNTSACWITRNKHLLQWSKHRKYCMYTLQIWHNE